jgi:DNA-directed RNA polymerase subunit RPC12/RpoP
MYVCECCGRQHDLKDPSDTLIYRRTVKERPAFMQRLVDNLCDDPAHAFKEHKCGKCGAPWTKFTMVDNKPVYVCECGAQMRV